MTAIAFVLLGAAVSAAPCESLSSLQLPNTTITSAVVVPEGPPPARGGGAGAGARGGGARGAAGAAATPAGQAPARSGAPVANIPAHCRVQAILKPTSDSLINMEIWLPTQ